MNEYKYILNGMDYAINERPSYHEMPHDAVSERGDKAQDDHRTSSPIRAAVIAVTNLVTR